MAETYETLKSKLGDWVAADIKRLPELVRGDCINFAMREAMRNHDLRFGEISDTIALAAADREYDIPPEWRNPLSLWYVNPATDSKIDLIRLSKDEFDARYPDPTTTGTPRHYAAWGLVLYIGPTPGEALTLNRNYYRFLPDLENGAPDNTNAFVVQAWDVLFFGALARASAYILEDPRAPMWEGQFMKLASQLANEHQREKSSGRVPQSREPG